MKIKTSELSGVQLDWAVAKCEGHEVKFECNLLFFSDKLQMLDYGITYAPSKDWEYGGPIIERERINVGPDFVSGWSANHRIKGPTPLVAAMRCYVASKLGDEVEVPDGIA
jgi:hypothetical protein